jgi:hypothetical protein
MLCKKFKKSVAIALAIVTISLPLSNTVSAMEPNNQSVNVTTKSIDTILSQVDGNVDGMDINALTIDLYNELHSNGDVEDSSTNGSRSKRSVESVALKAASKWLKSNASKILKVLGKYAALKGGVHWFIDMVDAVVGFSDSIDDLVYNVVDKCLPSLSNKQVKAVSNVIRVLMPF